MSKYCHGEPKCNANQFCECLPEGVEVDGNTSTTSEGFKVMWNGIIASHCRTPKQALAKARKFNKKSDTNEYVAVRVTTTKKTEVLKETK